MIAELVMTVAVHRPHHVSRSETREPLTVPAHDWSAVSDCESTRRWHITNPPYYGGLQFDLTTWVSNGGLRYATRPDLATKAEQIAVAERLYASRGSAPWPRCGQYLQAAA